MEEIKDRDYFKKLAHQLMFDLSDEEADDIVREFATLNKQLELLQRIDTAGVEEMIYPFEEDTYYLREDEVTHTISQAEAMSNAPVNVSGHFAVPKVVK